MFFALVALPLTLWAGKVTREQALKTATGFMGGKTFVTAGSYNRAQRVSQSTNEEPFYVFNATDGGYVIVSGDDRTREILGYSQTGTLDMENLPANLQWWLDEYARQIEALGTSAVAVKPLTLSAASDIPPLIHTQWNQQGPYNYRCPDGNGKEYYETDYSASNRCYTGCVATAMAQVMNYWQWPESCPALKAYSTESMDVKSLRATTFKWEMMKYSYKYNETGEAANAVAELMRYCGQAVHMNYGTDESSASLSREVMVNTFNYSPNIVGIRRNSYKLSDWEEIIYNELAEGRPVLYSGRNSSSGHAFVIDGYSSNGLFHINWGWGGYQDDYFVLSIADPSHPGISNESSSEAFSTNQYALIGVKPIREGDAEPYAVMSDEDQTVTFYYDAQKKSRGGIDINNSPLDNNSPYGSATRAIIDESFVGYRPFSTAYWFQDCSLLRTIAGIKNIKTDYVTDMKGMFRGCSGLIFLDVSGFKTDYVTYMSSMFRGCSSLKRLDVSNFKTDNVTYMGQMFSDCSSLTSLDVSGFKTDNVTDMGSMFYGCSSLKSLDVSGFKTDNVTYMEAMFQGCSSLPSLDVSGFKTGKVTNMSAMFSMCSGLPSLDLSGFKTDNVTDMRSMFYGCSSLPSLDLSSFKTDNVTYMGSMFNRCSGLTAIYAGEGWSTDKVESSENMFYYCSKLIGEQGTIYSYSYTDHTYARIDGGKDNPGYFTYRESTGIHAVNTEGVSTKGDIYDTKGLKHKHYTKGLNILRMSDGTTKKVVIK
jgi:surface protein